MGEICGRFQKLVFEDAAIGDIAAFVFSLYKTPKPARYSNLEADCAGAVLFSAAPEVPPDFKINGPNQTIM
jgi:hypothetical protein